MEVSESNFCLQLQFGYQASGPLVYQDLQAKQVLEIVQSFNVLFSSDRSSDRFTGKPVTQATGLYYDYARWYDPSTGGLSVWIHLRASCLILRARTATLMPVIFQRF